MSAVRTFKDIVRHVLHRLGYIRRFAYLRGDRKENFAAIYDQKVWTHGSDEAPLSGHGSSLQATAEFRKALPEIVERVKAKTLLDLGCGDFTWMQHVELKCDYIGVDIVPSVIERNQRGFSSPHRSFQITDFVDTAPPRADIVLCREVLFHLSLKDALAGLRNALTSGCSHFLLTSDSSAIFNADIQSGDFRTLNLEKRPFRLPPAQVRIEDAALSNGRHMGLWTAAEIREAIG